MPLIQVWKIPLSGKNKGKPRFWRRIFVPIVPTIDQYITVYTDDGPSIYKVKAVDYEFSHWNGFSIRLVIRRIPKGHSAGVWHP